MGSQNKVLLPHTQNIIIYSNFLPCIEKINQVYNFKITISLTIKHLSDASNKFPPHKKRVFTYYVSNFDIAFCSTSSKEIFIFILNQRLVPDHKYLTNFELKKKTNHNTLKNIEFPIIQAQNYTITVSPAIKLPPHPNPNSLYDIHFLHNKSSATPNNYKKNIFSKKKINKNPINRAESIKGKSFEEIYQKLVERKKQNNKLNV